jgi:hypothetical protein
MEPAKGGSGMAAAAAPDLAARSRDQLGLAFLALSVLLAAGAVVAELDPHRTWLRHHAWWWVGFSLLFATPAILFFMVPWTMRAHFGVAPRGAVEDATRGFYVFLGWVLALALLDAAALGLAALAGMGGPARALLGYGLAPLVLSLAAARAARAPAACFAAHLPASAYANVLLVEWASGLLGTALVPDYFS